MERKTPQQWMADEQYRGLVVVKPRSPRSGEPFLAWWHTPVTEKEFFGWLRASEVEARGYVQGAGVAQLPLLEEA
jgi:hypothetical protein